MNLVHSKDIYNIMRDVLKCLDPRIVNHGQRTAYILYSMLRDTNRYEMYELAEFAMTAVFHDIGAFETNVDDETLNYEAKDCMPHSIYGYLLSSKVRIFISLFSTSSNNLSGLILSL